MDIFENFNKKIDKLTDKLIELADKDLLSSYDIQMYNTAINNIVAIQQYFNKSAETGLNLSQEAMQVWKNFETNRAVFFAKPYTPISRKIAVKKIMSLAEGVEEDFINIVEWAIAWNYKEIMPNILNLIERKKETKTDPGELFKNSKHANYNTFLHFFCNHNFYNEADFKAYYTKILSWSESKGKLSKHWGFIGLQFIENDINKKQLIRLTPNQRTKETLTDTTKLLAIWKTITKDIKELQKVEPVKLFRLNLTLKLSKEEYELIENTYLKKIKQNLPENIKFITYKLKN